MIPPELSREQLEKRLVALHAASIELVKEISLDSLLERIGTIAMELADAKYAAVGVLDDSGTLVRFIPLGMTHDEIDKIPYPPKGLGLIGAIMHTGKSILLPDIHADPRSVGFPLYHPEMKTFLGVPIMHGEKHLGQIYLGEKKNNEQFTLDDQMIIEMLASYASVAIVNAHLYRELIARDRILTRRIESLSLLNQLASTLAMSTEIEQVVEQGLSQLMDYLQLEVGEVFLRQEESKNLILKIHRGGETSNLWSRSAFLIGEGTVGKAAKSGNLQVIDLPDKTISDLDPEIIDQGIRRIVILPLNGRLGLTGVMCVATCHPRPSNEQELQFLQAISSWMATALENLKLNLQGKRLAVLEERERIGMDLHDGIIQSIYAVGLTLEHARLLLNEDTEKASSRIDQAIKDLNSTIRDIRAYILDLRPRQLRNENLMNGIQRLIHEFCANSLSEVHLQGPADDMKDLPEPQALALFHICQETLANIAKHARARNVDIVVWRTNDRALLEIRDDGRGFNPDQITISLGHGLSNMQTRATNVGGEVDITSEIGSGTTMLAWVPYPSHEDPISE